jgi:predicted O-methyltransferase YrrM
MIRAALRHYFTANDQHGLHSPFVFDLYKNVIEKDSESPDFERIESIRAENRANQKMIHITDFGAGSVVNTSKIRKVKDIAQNSDKAPRLGRLFYRLVQYFDANYIFDLGTSLGFTTLYLMKAKPLACIYTFEGCPQTAKIAEQNFVKATGWNTALQPKHHHLVVGNIDQTLPQATADVPRIDFAFFDANHRYEPTVRYFETCVAKAHNGSLFVFDDIHWSPDMEAAWEYIKAHPQTTATIDLFSVGLVFFRKQQHKQNFILKWPFWKK